jgi:hypothetical protein
MACLRQEGGGGGVEAYVLYGLRVSEYAGLVDVV